jgi:hypothetical protein
VIPLWLAGLWPAHAALRPAGRWLALIPVLFFAYGIVLASGFHGAFAFYAAGYQALGAAPADAQRLLAELTERFRAYHDALFVLLAATWTIGSVGFIVVTVFFRIHLCALDGRPLAAPRADHDAPHAGSPRPVRRIRATDPRHGDVDALLRRLDRRRLEHRGRARLRGPAAMTHSPS